MKHEELYEKKKRCEIAIEEIKFEIQQVASYPASPSKQRKLDRLDAELTLEYEALGRDEPMSYPAFNRPKN